MSEFSASAVINQTEKFLTKHYERLPVVIVEGRRSKLMDIDGVEYLDMLAGYGAVNFGHNNQKLLQAFTNQFHRVGLISSNFHNDAVGEFAERLVNFVGLPQAKVLLMNTGAEAVEKAIKLCRRWGYYVKGVLPDQAEIIVSDSNFHGRTYGVLSASPVPKYRDGFGPFMSGFRFTKFGDIEDLKRAINKNSVAFLVEPIQGEGGFIFPPDGYLKKAEKLCKMHGVLFVLDEIPTGFGRIGDIFSHFHYKLFPDMVILGKALGGGIYPVSAVVAPVGVMDVIGPGDEGSTFGGNPLAASLGLMAITLTQEENLVEKSRKLGAYFIRELQKMKSEMIKEVRGLGLFVGIELNEPFKAKDVCWELMKNKIITVPARGNVIRLTPPLVIEKNEIESALDRLDVILRTEIRV